MIAALSAAVWTVYEIAFPNTTYRYRLTVEVQAGNQTYQGSAVREVYCQETPHWLFGGGAGCRAVGEAVPVSIVGDNVLFALLRGKDEDASDGSAELIAFYSYDASVNGDPRRTSGVMEGVRQINGSFKVPERALPLLVRFRDPRDARTIEALEPHGLAKSFGSDARLSKAMITIVPAGVWPINQLGLAWPEFLTGVPVTDAVRQNLPWWNGPFPWLKPQGSGLMAYDTRAAKLRAQKEDFRREW